MIDGKEYSTKEPSGKDPMGSPLLTDEELSALTDRSSRDGNSVPARERQHRITTYDFRRPDRVSKEHVRSLYLLHDTFARSLSSTLPTFLRAFGEVTLLSVEQRPYVEYLSGLPDPAAIFKLSMLPLQGPGVLELSPSVAFAVLDRQLGGTGQVLADNRALTEIEQKVVEGFLKIVNEALRAAWRQIIEIEFQILECETSPKLLQIVAPNEVVLCLVFHVRVGDTRGTMSLCIPAINIEPILPQLNESTYSRRHPTVPPEQTRVMLDNVYTLPFTVAAELRGTKATFDDLMHLTAGDLLRLDHRVGEPVNVSISDIVKFRGELASRDRRTAVLIQPLADGEGATESL